MDPILLTALAIIALGSALLSPRVKTIDGFFKGYDEDGTQPSLLTLTLSQVTTWIFARSLLTAAILGYYYGIAGGLAYAAYYGSFFTGGAIIQAIRFQHGYGSVQDLLRARFGKTGTWAYNFVIGLRLLSEVFANLLVIGIIFGEAGSSAYTWSIILLAGFILVYSMFGGLRASLRTDVFQMSLFLALLIYLMVEMVGLPSWDVGAVISSSPDWGGAGWILLVVALLQVWSYPLHDPVMMDRGFIADRETTNKSFLYAGLLSIPCILGFSLLGVLAGLEAGQGEKMLDVLTRMFGDTTMTIFQITLIVSAVSTLDSTFSSSAKLAVVDGKLVQPTLTNGRIAMALFMVGGLLMLFFGSKNLFDAVAVSGTASMYLAPVIFFTIWAGKDVPVWSYVVSFVVALGGAALYFTEAGGTTNLITPVTGIEHKYAKLLLISCVVMIVGNGAFAIGAAMRGWRSVLSSA